MSDILAGRTLVLIAMFLAVAAIAVLAALRERR
jgi:hypothetical protein